MKIGTAVLLSLMLSAGMALADTGLRPVQRPADLAGPLAPRMTEPSLAPSRDLRPQMRPASLLAMAVPIMKRPAVEAGLVDAGLLAALAKAASVPPYTTPMHDVAPLPRSVAVLQTQPRVQPSQVMTAGPASRVVLTVSTSGQVAPSLMRPRLRPADFALIQPAVMVVPPTATLALKRSLRPEPRPALQRPQTGEPDAVVVPAAVVRVQPGKTGVFGKKGSVCGDPAIKGQTISPITSRVRGCGVDEAVLVTSISGVKLSEAATIDCNTARALNAWVEQGLQPQFSRDPVVQLRVAGHYICRSRNNVSGAKISEHGRGKAIDISGFVLASGEVVSIASDWRSKSHGRLIKAAHKAACGVFNTTLGPGSDGYHEDHLHFDTASGRGPYCR
jgi:hypothetical protein